ncbi:MAG TPA: hypothetical protein PLP88_12245, partial [Bacteroidales bacterium]|nr:hypothetical protein [Bacteroidales bacterium]
MPTQLEYMQLATRVYAASDNNTIDLPAGWNEVDWLPDQGSGFSAGVYVSGTEIVIAYAGTNESMDYLSYVAAAGLPATQVFAAMSYYLTFRDAYPSYNISFTGHSLGGGLASLMAVFFDKQATVFDEMPTQLSALDPMVYTTALLSMTAAGYYDENFDSYVRSAGSLALTRESKVTQYYINDEFLNTLRISANTLVGSDNPLPMGKSTASIWEKHSMALMLAWWASPAFRTAVQTLPNLVTQLADENLYAASRNAAKEDLLLKLIRHQFGTTDGIVPDAMLTRFGEDMKKIAQSGGLTMNENIAKALTAFAMQMYYENPAAADPEKYMVLFDEYGVSGGIHFNRKDVADEYINVNAKARHYFENYLSFLPGAEINLEALNAVKKNLPNLIDWYIQAGASPMNATAGSNPAFMLGGTGNDTLTGG